MGDTKSNTDATGLKLIRKRQVIRFLCLFLLVYGLLMAPWPGLKAAYLELYKVGAVLVFKSFESIGVVRLDEPTDAKYDMKIVFYDRDQIGPDGKMVHLAFMHHSSRRTGYIFIAFLTALILATPIGWRRRGWALLWGMILLHGFIIFILAAWILRGFNSEAVSLLVLSPFWQRVLLLTVYVFVHNLTFGFVVCVFIWILVSFRREDWVNIVTRTRIHRK